MPEKDGKMTPIDWIVGDDTGTSSKAIWAVMMGANTADLIRDMCVPWDPSDFGRCYRLLKLFPGWRDRLHEVAAAIPAWGPMVQNWDELTRLYELELSEKTGEAPRTYALMKSIEPECYRAAGFRKVGHAGWMRATARTRTI